MNGTIELGLHDIRINGMKYEHTETSLTIEARGDYMQDKFTLALKGFREDYQRLLDMYAWWAEAHKTRAVGLHIPPYGITGKLDDGSKVKMNFLPDNCGHDHDRRTVELSGPVINYGVIEEPAEIRIRKKLNDFEATHADKPDYIAIGPKVVENISKQLKSMMLISIQTEEDIKAEALKKKYGTIMKFDDITIIPLHGVDDNYIECVKYKHWTDTGIPIYK